MGVALGHNGIYMVAAYVITAVILVGYALVLWRRSKKGAREPGSPAP